MIIIGPTGIGKTIWARGLRPSSHVHFSGTYAYGKLGITRQSFASVSTDNIDYAIFDDIKGGLRYFMDYKSWLGHQNSFDVDAKYAGRATIEWGKPAIWLCNNKEWSLDGADEKATIDWDWIRERCTIVELTEEDIRERGMIATVLDLPTVEDSSSGSVDADPVDS